MFRALVDRGKELEGDGLLPPVGFYDYSQPIKWIAHFDSSSIYLEETELERPRPFSGRSSGVMPHLLADEAAYAFGASGQLADQDRRSAAKHEAFLELLRRLLMWDQLVDDDLRAALEDLAVVLKSGSADQSERFEQVQAKDWVSFVPADGPLKGLHLFESPPAAAFWAQVLAENSAPGTDRNPRTVRGQCAICLRDETLLVGRIRTKVRLTSSTGPLHSFNASAFPSFVSGGSAADNAHLGICFDCGDTASRAFNYLSGSKLSRRVLIRDRKSDSLGNHVALFWLRSPEHTEIQVGAESIATVDIVEAMGDLLSLTREAPGSPPPDLSQVDRLLSEPWKPSAAGLSLDDVAFCVLVASPNVGRIAVRLWLETPLSKLKRNLTRFHSACKVVTPKGDGALAAPLASVLEALGTSDPGLTTGLLRSAFQGHQPQSGLLVLSVTRLRNPAVWRDPKKMWVLHSLISALKLALQFAKGEGMEELDLNRKTFPYSAGRLLAVLEQAQLRSANFRLNSTIVDRYYGSASTTPAYVFAPLIKTATVAHLKDAGRELNTLVETLMSEIDKAGGFRPSLSLAEQADFALGFYHQRAQLRARSQNASKRPEGEQVAHVKEEA